MELPFVECYKIKVVETIRRSTLIEREKWLQKADFNIFNLTSDQVFIDLLTDSGTGAMSDKQWGDMMVGDESYAGSKSYRKMATAIKNILGFKYCLPSHQGRAAENVLHSCLVKDGDVIPGNAFFDTTQWHIDFRKGTTVDCTIDAAYDTDAHHDFKGNIDLKKLEDVLSSNSRDRIPMIVITVTCNSVGGQPVSMENIKSVSSMAKNFGIPVCFDAARFAQNAYFIKMREDGYKDKSIKQIAKEMFSYADIATVSAKKDAIVNIGGFLAFKDEGLWKKASVFTILFEGYVQYGGMSGRDMEALARGLHEGTSFDVLDTHIKQVEYLARRLKEYDVPIQTPVGGNGIYVDAGKILSHIPKEQFRAQTLVCELYLEAGIRSAAMATLPTDRNLISRQYPKNEYVRLALPRRCYTNSHLDYAAVAVANVMNRRGNVTHGLQTVNEATQEPQFVYAANIMKHFAIRLKRFEDKHQNQQ